MIVCYVDKTVAFLHFTINIGTWSMLLCTIFFFFGNYLGIRRQVPTIQSDFMFQFTKSLPLMILIVFTALNNVNKKQKLVKKSYYKINNFRPPL